MKSRFKKGASDSGPRGDFESIITRMADPSVGWIKRAVESDSEVGVDWTALGGAKAREMAKLVKPFTDWLGDKRKPKPSEADQFDCLLRLAPYVVELGPPQMDEVESLKLIAFISQLAPK